MPVALGGQPELRKHFSSTSRSRLGLAGFNEASSLPSAVHSSLNPLFGELDSEEREVQSARPEQAPAAASLSANPLFNKTADSVSLASGFQKSFSSYYVHPVTGQVQGSQVI